MGKEDSGEDDSKGALDEVMDGLGVTEIRVRLKEGEFVGQEYELVTE